MTTFARHTRLLALPLGTIALTVGLAACSSPATPTAAAPNGATDYVYDGQDHSWKDDVAPSLTSLSIDAGDNSLSNEPWTAATSGWGPAERDMSNGEKGSKDGHKLTLNGKQYDRGFGVHANSSLSFNVGGKCTAFTADVGVDDEVGNRGSVVFQVYADGQKLFDSGVMRGADGAKSVNVSIAGKQELKLVVTDAGDGISYDHADWASAMLKKCVTTGTAPPPSPVPTPTPTPSPTPAPLPPSNVQYSGPLVITKGGTYSGNWQSLDPKVPAVNVKTSDPVTIVNSNIRSKGNLITGSGSRLTIRNTRGYGLNPNIVGKGFGNFVSLNGVKNLLMENNYTENTRGINLYQYTGNASAGETVRIYRNQFRNMNGRTSDGNGGLTNNIIVTHTILFNALKTIAGVDIAWNEVINEPGKSQTEENFIMYSTSGTVSSPIKIHDNYIQGAYSVNPATDASYAGGGILLGDGRVYDNGSNANVYNNQIVNTTNQGLAISGGVNHRVYNNRVISSGRLPNGQRIPSQNIGIYIWDVNNGAKYSPVTFANNVMSNNVIAWTKVKADGTSVASPMWMPSCGINGTTCVNNQSLGIATLDTEKQEYQLWKSKLTSNNIRVGVY